MPPAWPRPEPEKDPAAASLGHKARRPAGFRVDENARLARSLDKHSLSPRAAWSSLAVNGPIVHLPMSVSIKNDMDQTVQLHFEGARQFSPLSDMIGL